MRKGVKVTQAPGALDVNTDPPMASERDDREIGGMRNIEVEPGTSRRGEHGGFAKAPIPKLNFAWRHIQVPPQQRAYCRAGSDKAIPILIPSKVAGSPALGRREQQLTRIFEKWRVIEPRDPQVDLAAWQRPTNRLGYSGDPVWRRFGGDHIRHDGAM